MPVPDGIMKPTGIGQRDYTMEAKRQPMRVLIVDDDPPSLKMTAFLLAEEGYEVATADNGLDALRLVEQQAPDLVILDVMMPGLDGLQVTQRIRRRSCLTHYRHTGSAELNRSCSSRASVLW